ncbi:hypothetical protein TREMEDRAFT_42834 [Tremella mesenterica DSM 1558]|uniref:uncharacterized protein n=1 Tax=Tremella mesenterica (strain ATCC 24925 / CBS 8224 / DSM 1558 / NBRC 9311 / NRRL Y-6157 / RJB 2259-6 / UBC 559-6) TaxID=578456 RepID=UPI0003F49292|nr:uncharacterized protein TREMEDRAFT_42834 [Tremella mesenterica DSM 1558]EIW71451.1 hypothetical protein TREMEDRAFT_42834 [Tremella mesenterica DSM 1558]
MLNSSLDPIQRQSAGLLLQQYINVHWSDAADKFKPPLVPPEIKLQLRPSILHILSEPHRKIRSAGAFAAAAIAKLDWPEEWPELVPSLSELLQSDNVDACQGAMSMLTEFLDEGMSEDQLQPVIQSLAPPMLAILQKKEMHSPFTRAQTVDVFREIVATFHGSNNKRSDLQQAAMGFIGSWTSAFEELLAADAATEVARDWDEILVRKQIIEAYSLLQTRKTTTDFPRHTHLVVSNLISLIPAYQIYYVASSSSGREPPSTTSRAHSKDPASSLVELACAAFDFLEPAVRSPKVREALLEGPRGGETPTMLMRALMESVETWLDDPNAFLIDDDESSGNYNARICGHDVIGSLIDKYPTPVVHLLQEMCVSVIQDCSKKRQERDPDWWQRLEALFAMLCGISSDLRTQAEADINAGRSPKLDYNAMFTLILPSALNYNDVPFLQARAFQFVSLFAQLLSEDLCRQYLVVAVSALQSPDHSTTVKLAAVRAIRNFCRFVDVSFIRVHSRAMLDYLVGILPHATKETLYLTLETIEALLVLDTELLTVETAFMIAKSLHDVWFTNYEDPVTTGSIEDLLDVLVDTSPPITRIVVMTLGPNLSKAILTVDDKSNHLPCEAIQLANRLVRTRDGPLESELIDTVTWAIMNFLRVSEDSDAIQVNHRFRLLIKMADEQYVDGIHYIYGLLDRFLAPTFPEDGAIAVGGLVMHLLRKAPGPIQPVLLDILQALVNRLVTAQLPSLIQSLVLPFAYLFVEHTEEILELLSKLDARMPDGSTTLALPVVLNQWCEMSDTISGSWNIRVSDLGLARLFMAPVPLLQQIQVKGDMIITQTNSKEYMTRSKTKANPIQHTMIPFPVKVLKLLLHEVEDVGHEKRLSGLADVVEEDDGDADWSDDDPLGGSDQGTQLAALQGLPDVSDEQDDDDDLKSDPISQIDLPVHLISVLRQAYTTNSNGIHQMIPLLTPEEKSNLRRVLSA